MSYDDIYSFYKLISEYKITIPVIQRAYAEGRRTKQAEDVRKSIVASIIKATAENKPLFFDFVYGNVLPPENKGAMSKFVPFDGQQRLTTLFLFHRYVFERANEPRNILKNFSYETRASAKEFIEKLCDNDIIPADKSDVSDYIKDQKWFYTAWLNDPTISSMLVVLDEIHKQTCEQNIDFCKALSHLKDSTITFHFLNMEENGLPAATYVKMNARGKSLTAFENFKASLEEFLKDKEDKEDKNEKLSETFKNNIDGKWLDLFYAQTKPDLPDALIMAFFNRHLLNVWVLEFPNISGDNSPDELYALNEKIRSDLIPFPQIDTFISWDIYKTILAKCPIEKTIRPIFNFLEYACDENQDPIIKNIRPYQKWDVFKGKVSNLSESDEPYPFKVAFYALMSYFGQDGYDTKSFSDWMRIVWNIVENQTIDDNDSYLYALRLFDELAKNSHRIYEFLSDSNNKITSDFAKEQVEEERLKARKILVSPAWEEKILEAERYEILLGKINILFQSGENTTEDEFERRFTLLKSLHKNEDKYHIVKVLVSYYNKQIPSEKINLINTPENLKQLVTKVFFKEFKIIETDTINPAIKYEWIKELARTTLLNKSRGKNLKKYGDKIVLWGTSGCVWSTFGNEVWGNVILGDSKRNAVLKSLGLPNDAFETDYKLKDYIYFSGWYTNFKFEDNFFQWWTRENMKQCDIYLMEEDWGDYKKRGKPLTDKTNAEADEYFAFNVTDGMLKNPELVRSEMRKLIKEAER